MARATVPPPPLAACAKRALGKLAAIGDSPRLRELSGSELLMERAVLNRSEFTSGQSAAGTCRFLETQTGTIAANLPRESDWALIPAWLQCASEQQWAWSALAKAVQKRESEPLIEQARLLGMPIAPANAPLPTPADFCHVVGPPLTEGSKPRTRPPVVIDLSALWAGPLCSHLLQICGAEIIKVESTKRPDGGRFGNTTFYDLLNQGKRAVGLDLNKREGQRILRELLSKADIVIESSRPRALRQMGICAEDMVRNTNGLTWISITGYGRDEPEANWIAFGDDAGAAAGLSDVMQAATGSYEFAGDAIADPLTGIHAALAAWHSWQSGGGRLVTLSLAQLACWCLHDEIGRIGRPELERSFRVWRESVLRGGHKGRHSHRPITHHVAGIGEDTKQVLHRLNIRC